MVDRNDEKLDGVGRPDGEVSTSMSADLTQCDGVSDQNDRVIVSEEYVEVLAPEPQWTCMALQRGLTLFSDLMSRVFFHGQNELVAHLLRHVTGDPSIVIKEVRTQVIYSNVNGRSAQLDIVARDTKGTIYDIEVQGQREKSLINRAYFYGATLLMNEVKAGTSFDEFPRVCVVFLLEHGEGCNGQLVEKANTVGTSGTHMNVPVDIYFVNGALQDESALGTMMGDMRSTELTQFKDCYFSARMNMLLYTDIGRREMCEAERIWIEEVEADALKRGEANGLKKGLEKGREEGEANGLKKGREEGEANGLKKGLKKGREEGREEVMRDIVHSMIAQKFDDSIITYTTGMPLARIQDMRREMQLV